MASSNLTNTANPQSSITSTNYDSKMALMTLFPLYNIQYQDGTIEQRRDYQAQIARKIKRIRKCVPYVYQGYNTLTTDIFKLYGNTTTVWIFLIYNAVHRLELVPSRTYKMPDISEIQTILTKKSGSTKSLIGTTQTI